MLVCFGSEVRLCVPSQHVGWNIALFYLTTTGSKDSNDFGHFLLPIKVAEVFQSSSQCKKEYEIK